MKKEQTTLKQTSLTTQTFLFIRSKNGKLFSANPESAWCGGTQHVHLLSRPVPGSSPSAAVEHQVQTRASHILNRWTSPYEQPCSSYTSTTEEVSEDLALWVWSVGLPRGVQAGSTGGCLSCCSTGPALSEVQQADRVNATGLP